MGKGNNPVSSTNKWRNRKNNNNKEGIYYRLKEIKDIYRSNALGGPYLDLIQRVNCKKPFLRKIKGRDSVLGNVKELGYRESVNVYDNVLLCPTDIHTKYL